MSDLHFNQPFLIRESLIPFLIALRPTRGVRSGRGAIWKRSAQRRRARPERCRDGERGYPPSLDLCCMDRAALQERFGLLGTSPALFRVLDRVRLVARTDVTVLLQGESGVGKELLAQALHGLSGRRHGPLVIVNCGAIPEGLIESELFGAEKGAYTGSVERRTGYFEEADGGTVFLDEVGELPPAAQVRLLRVLETGQYARVGSSQTRQSDVRVVAATNRDLGREVQAGRFREDLYYRLSTVLIDVPPLRARREDIGLLFEHFVRRFTDRYNTGARRLDADAARLLDAYTWPGNVRELRNVIESLVVQDINGILDLDDLQDGDSLKGLSIERPGQSSGLVGRPLSEVERFYIERTLEATGGNREEAARKLGIGERTLYRVIQEWKQQDRVRDALKENGGDVEKAAAALKMRPQLMQRKLKKWGMEV